MTLKYQDLPPQVQALLADQVGELAPPATERAPRRATSNRLARNAGIDDAVSGRSPRPPPDEAGLAYTEGYVIGTRRLADKLFKARRRR